MNKIFLRGILGAVLVTGIWGCSTKKDGFINRTYHATTTKFNVLYNGKNALEEGKSSLVESFEDNYWEVLPVERMEIKEVIALPGAQKNPNFERAEEKAVKAIQKHSMNIKNRQRNPQIDEAYLLLGQARYYDQRFIPALEAFNYILYKYPESDKINVAKVWREKTNIRLENEEVAIENLQRLMKQEKLKDQTYADARAIMAQAYLNLKVKDTAIQHLKVAAAMTKDNEERGRYYYIIGQLYNELGVKDTANIAFQKVIDLNRKTPRVYMINAYLEKAKNFEVDSLSRSILFETLTDLEENRENRPFLDKIYRQLAEFHLEGDSVDLAVQYFNKSLTKSKANRDRFLTGLNYENLATIKFDDRLYRDAGAYYDSTLLVLKENTKKYRSLRRKRDNLEDVINYEDVAERNDSIMHLVNLTEPERVMLFEKVIADLKAEEEAAKKAEEEAAAIRDNEFFQAGNTSGPNTDGGFYFYNPVTLGYGKNEFQKTWGDRPLEDDWRLSNKQRVSREVLETSQDIAQDEAREEKRFSLSFYLDRIPKDEQVIDSIVKERDFAYYQLGLIYKEKFKEYDLAAEKLETLLDNKPEEKLVLPSKYNLYKIYTTTGSQKAIGVKNDIINNHPDSRYAEILLNPQVVTSTDENSPEAVYAKLFRDFEAQEYEKTIDASEEAIKQFNGEDIVPKFELLKATAIGRLDGLEAYKQALNYVALNYPNNPEGKEAQDRVNRSLKPLSDKTLDTTTVKGKAKLVFPFEKKEDNKEAMAKLSETIEMAIKELRYLNCSVSTDVYDREKVFVVVHGFEGTDKAEGFAELLNINKDYLVDNENFVVLSSNYKIIQVHKNLNEYTK